MNKLAERLGLEKVAYDEAKDLFHKAAEALGIDMSSLENLFAEVDSRSAIDKVASELGIHPDITAIIVSEAAGNVSRETLEKTAAEKKVDAVELAYSVFDKNFVPGEISKIACATMVKFAQKGDLKLPLEKSAEAIGATKDDINVTAVAIELSSEGHSPELLKTAAEEAKVDFRKLATQIIEGENWAAEKIAAANLNGEMMKKLSGSEKIPEGFFMGVMSAIDKLAEDFHPKGIADLFGLKKEASTEGKDLDLEVHNLMKIGAQLSGFGPEALQFLYSYHSPEYALDKHASVAEKGHEEMAKIAMTTIGRIGALVSTGKLEIPESIGETINKVAEIFKEKPEEAMKRLHITNSMLAGVHPAHIKEAGESNGGLDKMAEAITKEAIRQDEHEKIAGVQDEAEGESEEVEKYASFPFSYAETLEIEKDAGAKENLLKYLGALKGVALGAPGKARAAAKGFGGWMSPLFAKRPQGSPFLGSLLARIKANPLQAATLGVPAAGAAALLASKGKEK